MILNTPYHLKIKVIAKYYKNLLTVIVGNGLFCKALNNRETGFTELDWLGNWGYYMLKFELSAIKFAKRLLYLVVYTASLLERILIFTFLAIMILGNTYKMKLPSHFQKLTGQKYGFSGLFLPLWTVWLVNKDMDWSVLKGRTVFHKGRVILFLPYYLEHRSLHGWLFIWESGFN